MLGRALGPAIAVVAIKAWGVSAAFLINGITFIPVLGVLWRARAVTNATIASREPVRRVLADGARYTFTHAGIRLAVLLGLLIATLGQSLQGLTAALSKSVFGHASTDNAGLVAMVGVGALVASAITMTLEDRVARQKLVGVGLSIYVVSLALLPLTTNYWVGGFGFFLNGMAHLLCATTLNTMIQGTVPDHLRGRVLSFYLLGIMAGMPLGAQVMGLLGDVYGLRVVLAANAILMALIVLTVRLRGVLRVLDPEREAAPGHLTASAPAVAAT
jgi:MFS family permease